MGAQTEVRQSVFVTIVAWILIIISGYVMLSSLLQIVLFKFLYPALHMQHKMQQIMQSSGAPPLTRYIMAHHLVFSLIFLTLSTAMFIISIALLKRKKWARVACVVFLVIGIGWQLVTFINSLNSFQHMPVIPGNLPPQFKIFQKGAYIFGMVLATALIIAFTWFIQRLLSAKVRAEFEN